MSLLAFQAYSTLIWFDLYLGRDFSTLCNYVREYPISSRTRSDASVEMVCTAVDLACIWYWKEVLCLQRSTAAACLLKRNGVPARMVIGAQQDPFKAHAWVEVDARVVNDKSYMRETYAVLDTV